MTSIEVEDAAVEPGETGTAPVTEPIILDMGKLRKKSVRRLKKGRGRAMVEVMDIVEQVRDQLGGHASDKMILPVVVLYRRKRRRRRGGWF